MLVRWAKNELVVRRRHSGRRGQARGACSRDSVEVAGFERGCFLSVRSIVADEDGKFQFVGLAPGEYRILAVAPEVAEKLDEPHVLEQLLSAADRVTLTAGVAENQALRVTDPGR